MKTFLLSMLCTSSMVAAGPALADWHAGTITELGIGYDGATIVFAISGWSRTNCTCYSTWPTLACLDSSRQTFKQEYAWLLAARRSEANVSVNIDETTCKVVAVFEPG
jgi:hypothetical protein